MKRNINIFEYKNQEWKINIWVKKTLAALSLSVAAILAYDHGKSWDILEEKVEVIPHTPSNMNTGDKISKAILDKYDLLIGNKTEVVKWQEKTKSIIENILEKIFSKEEKKDEKLKKHEKEIDMYMLSIITKEYCDQNKKEVIGRNNGKAIILAFHKKTPRNRGEIVYLPIPPRNPYNDTIHINHKWVTFSITPYIKSNGYNTEYQITTGGVGEVIQLATLYPMELQEYKNIDMVAENIQSKIDEIENKISAIWKQRKTKKTEGAQQKQLSSLQSKKWLLEKELKLVERKLSQLQRYEYFSYIPFTERQNTKENQDRWFRYIAEKMKKTYETSIWERISDMPSSISWLTIWEAIPVNFPMVLNIIERMDFMDYYTKWATSTTLKDKKELEPLMISQINKSLTTFWLNWEEAFNWQRSRVGAMWVGQIMPQTYFLYREHPKYRLFLPEANFQKAAQSHDMSFRLQVAHFDDQIKQLPGIVKNNWKKLMSHNETKMWLMAILAAGYNGSMKRIVWEVFSWLEENDWFWKYKERLLPKNILEAMKKAKDLKVANVEAEIWELNKKASWKRKGITIWDQQQIKSKKEQITSINATFKESSTYVMKTVFVTSYLEQRYPWFKK